VRLDELPEETRLADAGLADDSYDLTVALADTLERQGQLLQLTINNYGLVFLKAVQEFQLGRWTRCDLLDLILAENVCTEYLIAI